MRNDREHQEQVALIKWARLSARRYLDVDLLYAIPNAGKRGRKLNPKTGKWYSIEGAKLKAEGMTPGVPDLFLPVPRTNWHGLYIELKAPKGVISAVQRTVMGRLAAQGYLCVVCWGWEPARGVIEAYYDQPRKWPDKGVEIIR